MLAMQFKFISSLEGTQALYLADSEGAPRGWVVGDVLGDHFQEQIVMVLTIVVSLSY